MSKQFVDVGIYLNRYIPKGIHVFYFPGGRGIGKSYSAYDYLLKQFNEHGKRFLYIRDTKVALEIASSSHGNCFKRYNRDKKININSKYNSRLGTGLIYNGEHKEENLIGYSCAFSTFSNVRGTDYSDIDIMLFDECVNQDGDKTRLSNPANSFYHMIETVNRNRALLGEEEITIIMLSNCIDLSDPLLVGIKFTTILTKMILNSQNEMYMPERSLFIKKYRMEQVSKEKQEKSFLYKFANDSAFVDESIIGNFKNKDFTLVAPKMKISEYKPYICFSDITIYKHKSKELYYAKNKSIKSSQYVYTELEQDKFKEDFYWAYKIIRRNNLLKVDDYATLVILDAYVGYKPSK